jgi:serine/threonine-protein kinase RsbW
MSDDRVLVRVPASPELVRVLRAVASSVAARTDMSFDAIEEVRIAVDEAATVLLGFPTADGAVLELMLEPLGDGLRARLALRPAVTGDPDGIRATWSWLVLEGLCQDVAFDPADAAIAFTKRGEAGTDA